MKELLHSSLAFPLGFPELSATFFPGDRVVLVPDHEMAFEPDIFDEISKILVEYGLSPKDISVILTEEEEKQRRSESILSSFPEVRILFHKSESRDDLALLGVDINDEPIALNRELVDADAVISIGRYHSKKKSHKPKNYFGPHSSIFPRFSDRKTLLRFDAAKGTLRRKLELEVEEVARQLGVLFTIQLLRRPGKPDIVVSGNPELVVEVLEKQV